MAVFAPCPKIVSKYSNIRREATRHLLRNQRREAAQDVVYHRHGRSFHETPAANRKVERARLIADDDALRLRARSHESACEARAARERVPLADGQRDDESPAVMLGRRNDKHVAPAALLLAAGGLEIDVIDVAAVGRTRHRSELLSPARRGLQPVLRDKWLVERAFQVELLFLELSKRVAAAHRR